MRAGEPLGKSICYLVRNCNYMLLFISTSLVRGSLAAFMTVMSWVVAPYGFGILTVGLMIFCAMLCGVLGCIMVGVLLRRTQMYKRISLGCATTGLLSVGLLQLVLETSSSAAAACIVSALTGLFLFPFMTTMAEFSTEVAFPVGDATSTGMVLAGAELFGFVAGMILEAVVDGESKARSRDVMLIFMGCIAMGALVLLYAKEDLLKHKYE